MTNRPKADDSAPDLKETDKNLPKDDANEDGKEDPKEPDQDIDWLEEHSADADDNTKVVTRGELRLFHEQFKGLFDYHRNR